ncbi:MAG: hypothetical protein C3F06_04080 [Candidatus Methanoperedenaceae archaeon]|nr:MAG: hypothetical protein C3F06_04080 [Candidatus Methanoperedenaceae archaeon]
MNKKVEKNDWNPEQYLKFKSERTQPAIDLVSRIIKRYEFFLKNWKPSFVKLVLRSYGMMKRMDL